MSDNNSIVIKWIKKIFSLQFLGIVTTIFVPFFIYFLEKPGEIKVLYNETEINSDKTIILSLNFISGDSICIGNKNVYKNTDNMLLSEMAFPVIKNNSRNAVKNLSYNISFNNSFLHVCDANAFANSINNNTCQLFNTKETVNSHNTYNNPLRMIKGLPNNSFFNIDYSIFVSCDGMLNERIIHYIPYFVITDSQEISDENIRLYIQRFFSDIRNKYTDNDFKNILISIGDSIVENLKEPNILQTASTVEELNIDDDGKNEGYKYWLMPIEPSYESNLFVKNIKNKSALDLIIFFSPALLIFILCVLGLLLKVKNKLLAYKHKEKYRHLLKNTIRSQSYQVRLTIVYSFIYALMLALSACIVFYYIKITRFHIFDGATFIYIAITLLPAILIKLNKDGYLDTETPIPYRWSLSFIAVSLVLSLLWGYNIFSCVIKCIAAVLSIEGLMMLFIFFLALIDNDELYIITGKENDNESKLITLWLFACFIIFTGLCKIGYI